MIITLVKADFSANNIGSLDSWMVNRALGVGATYNGPNMVEKGGSLSATVTLADGYSVTDAGVTITMGEAVVEGATINGQVITISIAEVTGNLVITIPTINTGTGEGDSEIINLIILGTLNENTVTASTNNTSLIASEVYFTYSDIPVAANTTYISEYGRRTFFLDSSKNVLNNGNAINIYSLTPQYVFTTPDDCAYVTISYKYSDIAPTDVTLTLHTS